MFARLLLLTLTWISIATPAIAKEYTASRFDSRIEVQPGGSLKVHETIVFVFTEGTFKQVFRVVPTRATDGVEFVEASMDGTVLPPGEGPGQVRVRSRDGLRVEWNFSPLSGSTHTFELTYLARGVVRQTARADLLQWRALPREHGYRIASTTVEVLAPEPPVEAPGLETRRVDGDSSVTVRGTTVTAQATTIRRNGSFVVSISLPRGSVLDGPPAWQARQIAHRQRMPLWLTTSVVIGLAGLMLIFALRQNYDAPPSDLGVRWGSMLPPDGTPPGIAGALAANGRPQLEHAMASLFSLAERGIVAIREGPHGRFGGRSFTIELLRRTTVPLHEQTALDLIFSSATSVGATVSLSKARTALTRHWSRFKNAVLRELADAQMIDPRRQASRKRYVQTGVVLLAIAAAGVIACAFLIEDHGGWPFLVPLAIALVAMTSFIVVASQTPLSNEGVRRAELWRAYQKHLSDPQQIEPRWGAGGTAEARILPFAVALGLAEAWSKFMKKRNAETPAWFQAASGLDSGHAFAALVATGGAGAHGGGVHGGGGVAGGGASGAR
ncbi:MAG: DUF2207 domain-containing protein [Acidobacteria bacterium]|nr:DUF2207 domain-containing protein [Acidobacteriota bacterium]